MPLIEEVAFFMVWFDPNLPVLCIHLNNTGPTARLTARSYRARINLGFVSLISGVTYLLPDSSRRGISISHAKSFLKKYS